MKTVLPVRQVNQKGVFIILNYSVFCNDYVFEDWENFSPEYEIIELKSHLKIQIERIANNQVRVIRIFSTNPRDYLRTDLFPGLIGEMYYESGDYYNFVAK